MGFVRVDQCVIGANTRRGLVAQYDRDQRAITRPAQLLADALAFRLGEQAGLDEFKRVTGRGCDEDALKLADRMPQTIEKAPTRDGAPEKVNARPPPDTETSGHTSRQSVQAAAIGPLRLPVLEGITLLDVSLLIEDPDGLRDINQVGGSEVPGDQGGAYCTPALDVLCAMIIGEALPPPGCRSSTYLIASLKHRYCMSGVTQGMCGGQSTTTSADYGD